jgi:hypothetical protein
MDELELIRQMRDSTPAITPQAEHAARTSLRRAITRPGLASATVPGPRRRPRSRRMWGFGIASTAAVAAACAVLASGTVPRAPASIRLDAAVVLDRAAGAISSQPGARPGPHQWIYIESTHLADPLNPRAVTDDLWLRADGRQIGFLRNGKLVVQDVPAGAAGGYSAVTSYDTLAKLPTDPKALLADIYAMPTGGNGLGSGSLAHQILGAPPLLPLGTGRNSSAFLNLAQLIWNSPAGAPPGVQAALYRAMAQIPGITVDVNARTVNGQPAISVGGLLFDPHTYQMIGARSVTPNSISQCPTAQGGATVANPHCRVIPAGTVLEEILQTGVKFVSAPGQR